MSNDLSSIKNYLQEKTFVVKSSIEGIEVGTRIKITSFSDKKISIEIAQLPEGSKYSKIDITTTEAFKSLKKYRVGSIHSVSYSTLLSKISAPEELNELMFDLTPIKGEYSMTIGIPPHLQFHEVEDKKTKKTTKYITVEGSTNAFTELMTGCIIVADTTKNGLPYLIGFVDHETYKNATFKMTKNRIDSDELYDILINFTSPGEYSNYDAPRGTRVLSIRYRDHYTIPNYPGVNFYKLRLSFNLFKDTFAPKVQEELQRISRSIRRSTEDLISDY